MTVNTIDPLFLDPGDPGDTPHTGFQNRHPTPSSSHLTGPGLYQTLRVETDRLQMLSTQISSEL